MAYLDARTLVDLVLTIPQAGGWLAEFHLDGGDVPSAGVATLTVGDLSLVGHVLEGRGGLDAADFPAVVMAGGSGWATRLPEPGGAYVSDRGVRLSTVLGDLARLCGEGYDTPTESSLGPAYGWDAGTPGRAVLADLVLRGAVPTWRVDPATGRTMFSAWPTTGAADGSGRIETRARARGAWGVALDNAVAAWLPGATIQGVTIGRLVLRERKSELRAEVWGA